MLAQVLSKPILRLSFAILVNENILRVFPVLANDISHRRLGRFAARKPTRVFTAEEISSGSIDSDDFSKSEYSDESNEKLTKPTLKSIVKEQRSSKQKINENILRVSPVLENDISHRRLSAHKPARVLTAEEISSGNIDSDDFSKSEYADESNEKLTKPTLKSIVKEQRSSKQRNYSRFSEMKDYDVLEEGDSRFSKLVMQCSNRKMRRKNNIMMLEGKRLNMDAIQAGLKPRSVFFTQKSLIDELNLIGSGVPLFKIPYHTLRLWSKLENPPGVIAFYGHPEEGQILTRETVPVRVLCDNVRDPGNMGSIIRVAASVGCTELLLTRGCTDPWDSKVLRSASGGHFHVPIKGDMTWEECEQAIPHSDKLWLADSNGGNYPEGNVSTQPYHSVDFTDAPSVVVIGGETEGLSREAVRLASVRRASRIHIPLSNCMESLNSGCALSVVLFEIKRQIRTAKDDVAVDKTMSRLTGG